MSDSGFGPKVKGPNNSNLMRLGRVAMLSLIGAVLIFALVPSVRTNYAMATSSSADDCPAYGNGDFHFAQPSSIYSVNIPSLSTSMSFDLTTPDKSAVNGVPGVIEFCVYPNGGDISTVTGETTSAVGANSALWNAGTDCSNGCVDSIRPDGNPSNIPDDGTTTSDILTVNFSDAPSSVIVVLHINDAEECANLGLNPGTCFVIPNGENGCPEGGCTPPGQDLTVTKTATPSFDQSYTWTIEKSVDKTRVEQIGGTATFTYTVKVTHDSGTDGNWKVKGQITVDNPNTFDVTGVTVTDAVDNGGTCTVTDGSDITVPGSGNAVLDYECDYSSAPSPGSGTNTATATWDAESNGTPDGSATGSESFDFASATPNLIDECVSVTDTIGGSLGTACVGDANPTTFTYQKTVNVPKNDCVNYDNTATFTTNDTGATGSASKTVTVCGPAKTGALTMGFWQNKNGQNIIKSYCGGTSGTTLYAYLTQYNQFKDLTSSNCSNIATYVYNVIKAANAGGSSMNPMLKAQDLASKLDVYFGTSSLGGNRIGAVNISTTHFDLTKICKMIDASGGTATCSGTFQDVSSAFGGATCMTIDEMNAYTSTRSNVGGTTWYNNVKSVQEMAKNAFDAINNGVAFSC